MKRFNLKIWSLTALLPSLILLSSIDARAEGSPPQNFWGNYNTQASTDVTKPVPDRSYFTTQVEEVPGGAKVIADFYHGMLNSPVSVSLQVAINDGKGGVRGITFMKLDDKLADNPVNYHSRREYKLDYKTLNEKLAAVLPKGTEHLKIGPGAPLFLFAEFHEWHHQWGGIGRGGIFFMPEGKHKATAEHSVNARRPVELDLAYPISTTMTLKYNDAAKGGQGLKLRGQIRSRLEAEGKFHIPLDQMDKMRKHLFDLANDPAAAARVLGPEWTVKAELRYMKKDAAGQMILDQHGLPTPDPMVDTYYDNDHYDAAKRDMAIRYRWTEQNQTGSWNFKPGLTHSSPEGVVYRLEYGLDATDDKPESIASFVDSSDPLNPFREIPNLIHGAKPSDFLKPSVKITDTRYKFKIQHTTGLVIEVSLDDVLAHDLRGSGNQIRYGQMEMDVDHLSTTSQNVAQLSNMPTGLKGELSPDDLAFLAKLDKDAFVDGRPVMHTQADLDQTSPVRAKHQGDFDLAAKAVLALREQVIGKDWIAGPQKYAVAATALDLVKPSEASPSVKKLGKLERKLKAEGKDPQLAAKVGAATCGAAFN